MDRLDEYRSAVGRIDAFASAVAGRRAADMACRAGCDACCRVELEVSPVEAASIRQHLDAVTPGVRLAIARRAAAQGVEADDRCVMLEADGRCAIYEARPLVCRSQGLPLLYPSGFVPASAIGLELGEKGEATWCPLNFTESAPAGEDILDAELVDRILAVVNQRWCAASGEDPLRRIALRSLAADV